MPADTQMAGIMLKGLGLVPSHPVCKSTEFCCPDAKHCLTPTKTSCAADGDAVRILLLPPQGSAL